MTGPTVLSASNALGWLRIWCERPRMFLVLPDQPNEPKVWCARLLLDGFLAARPEDQSIVEFDAWARKRTQGLEDQWIGEAILVLPEVKGNHLEAIGRLLALISTYLRECSGPSS